jgi:hypothetical protein
MRATLKMKIAIKHSTKVNPPCFLSITFLLLSGYDILLSPRLRAEWQGPKQVICASLSNKKPDSLFMPTPRNPVMISSLDFGNPAILFFSRTRGFPSSDYSEFGFVGLQFSIIRKAKDMPLKISPSRSIPSPLSNL